MTIRDWFRSTRTIDHAVDADRLLRAGADPTIDAVKVGGVWWCRTLKADVVVQIERRERFPRIFTDEP